MNHSRVCLRPSKIYQGWSSCGDILWDHCMRMWRWSLNCIETMGCWRLSNYDRCFEESCMYKVEFLQKKSYVHCSLVHVMNELLGPFADCVISSWYPATRDRATWFIIFPSGFKSWSFLVVHSILLGTSVFCSMPFFCVCDVWNSRDCF